MSTCKGSESEQQKEQITPLFGVPLYVAHVNSIALFIRCFIHRFGTSTAFLSHLLVMLLAVALECGVPTLFLYFLEELFYFWVCHVTPYLNWFTIFGV